MAAIINDLSIEKGATFQYDVTLSKSDGTPYDLTLYTISGTFVAGTVSYAMSFTEDTVLGIATWNLDAGETAVLARGVGRYEMFMTEDSSGNADRLLKGRVYVDGGAE